jgi:hypothetical protein
MSIAKLDPKAQAVFDALTELVTVALVKMPSPAHMEGILTSETVEVYGIAANLCSQLIRELADAHSVDPLELWQLMLATGRAQS